ncbi:MAG: hypothetical protein K6B72_00500 [Lachnospiraceae bacterium]|nr:hypothetical protein [Lachnospiraceae bacterium]
MALLMTACSTGNSEKEEIINLSADSLTIPAYTCASIQITNYDASWKNFEVTSSDEYIAVDASTLIGSDAELPEVEIQAFEIGEATLTFSAEGMKSATLKVKVTENFGDLPLSDEVP